MLYDVEPELLFHLLILLEITEDLRVGDIGIDLVDVYIYAQFFLMEST